MAGTFCKCNSGFQFMVLTRGFGKSFLTKSCVHGTLTKNNNLKIVKIKYSKVRKDMNAEEHLNEKATDVTVAKTDPEAAETKPEAVETKPEVAETKPEAAEIKPEAAETKPKTAENEPEAARIEAEAVSDEPVETMGDYARELEASFRKINEGDIISGTVLAVNEEEVVLDLRYYTQGIIKAGDMSKDPDFTLTQVPIGAVIEAAVVSTDDGQGNIRLSRIEANKVLVWDKLEQYRQEKRTFNVKVSGVTNGGVIGYLEDTRGFIPASQLSLDYVEDVNPWLNKSIEVRVITAERGKEKLVLSAKAILQEKARAARDRKVAMIVPGSVLEGTVESLMPYGAFINLGDGMSGLVHISQISQRRIKKPDEVLKVGDKVKAKVLNTNDGKISLSMKSLEADREADTIGDFHYESSGALTTSMAGLFDKIKLD